MDFKKKYKRKKQSKFKLSNFNFPIIILSLVSFFFIGSFIYEINSSKPLREESQIQYIPKLNSESDSIIVSEYRKPNLAKLLKKKFLWKKNWSQNNTKNTKWMWPKEYSFYV